MTIWQEKFNPKPIEPIPPTAEDFNNAWNWIFEKQDGEFIRAGLCLIVIREKSIQLHKSGVKDSAKVAAIGIWKRYCGVRKVESSLD